MSWARRSFSPELEVLGLVRDLDRAAKEGASHVAGVRHGQLCAHEAGLGARGRVLLHETEQEVLGVHLRAGGDREVQVGLAGLGGGFSGALAARVAPNYKNRDGQGHTHTQREGTELATRYGSAPESPTHEFPMTSSRHTFEKARTILFLRLVYEAVPRVRCGNKLTERYTRLNKVVSSLELRPTTELTKRCKNY